MSFAGAKSFVEENDTVILYLSINNMHAIQVTPKLTNKDGKMVDNVFQTQFGALRVISLVGTEYGSKPSPELWTLTLPHRTQIIYTPDISMILYQLEIKPGSVVIESGTGSGSLSHALIRAIKSTGHLHTFDFHEVRAQMAREEFQQHGIGDFVTVYHRDVCSNGFTEALNGSVDAVFLDLPAPWLAVPHAVKAFKSSGGRFCSFSPCIEQSQRCCEALDTHKFVEIQTMEIIHMESILKPRYIPTLELDFVKHKKTESENGEKPQGNPLETKKIVSATHPQSLPGHTGYLTFATFPPQHSR
ncbi:tRNA (adenine(58)-N(1))-methyltransferase catalytic subunit TRMT61A isoform X2 [Phlebotomus argentipes]|uniref:tRNA (adenine(58)-N(1))-methyltransferase catalytic subunit TRMT61A isoform X2 n=1 Tax=Phlebotomus argentipes TaxID=94469 RepID=UPI00289351A1|nr:tRNA (adenine(58)-N(1))-methyltransferase catalytic subunit TRMT61A isoform X2 [Phlebotomus argentipes]